MDDIDAFVRRELELKQTLPFGEWLSHIKQSHMELLRRLQSGHPRQDVIHVELLEPNHTGPTISTYALDGRCRRIIVETRNDVSRSSGQVWGFVPTDDPYRPTQINGRLVDRRPDVTQG